jgi:hypothetical protein
MTGQPVVRLRRLTPAAGATCWLLDGTGIMLASHNKHWKFLTSCSRLNLEPTRQWLQGSGLCDVTAPSRSEAVRWLVTAIASFGAPPAEMTALLRRGGPGRHRSPCGRFLVWRDEAGDHYRWIIRQVSQPSRRDWRARTLNEAARIVAQLDQVQAA